MTSDMLIRDLINTLSTYLAHPGRTLIEAHRMVDGELPEASNAFVNISAIRYVLPCEFPQFYLTQIDGLDFYLFDQDLEGLVASFGGVGPEWRT